MPDKDERRGGAQGKGKGKKPDEVAAELEQGTGDASKVDEKSRQKAAKLLRNPKFQQVMEQLRDDTAAQEEMKKDPKGFLQRKGIQDIDDAEVTFEEAE
jgi:hypothetical protein